jgi:hypothetical protein
MVTWPFPGVAVTPVGSAGAGVEDGIALTGVDPADSTLLIIEVTTK